MKKHLIIFTDIGDTIVNEGTEVKVPGTGTGSSTSAKRVMRVSISCKKTSGRECQTFFQLNKLNVYLTTTLTVLSKPLALMVQK